MTLLITSAQVTRTFSSKNTVGAGFYCLYLRFKIRKTFLISKPPFLGMGLPSYFGCLVISCGHLSCPTLGLFLLSLLHCSQTHVLSPCRTSPFNLQQQHSDCTAYIQCLLKALTKGQSSVPTEGCEKRVRTHTHTHAYLLPTFQIGPS